MGKRRGCRHRRCMTAEKPEQNPGQKTTSPAGESLRFAFVRFDGQDTAASRFASAYDRRAGVPWLREVGVVERHRDGRLVLRGSFAGRYVDVDEADHVSEPGAGRGALIGGAIGTLLGPAGIAVGLVVGGAVGAGVGTPTEMEPEPEPLADRLRDALAPGSSALVMVSGPQEIAEMLESIGAGAAEVTERELTPDERAAIQAEIDAAAPAPAAQA